MAAPERARRLAPAAAPARRPRSIEESRRRRREQVLRARRRQQAARRDVALGALLALIGLVAGPGLGILTLLAVLVLGGCAAWVIAERRGARTGGRDRRPGRGRPR